MPKRIRTTSIEEPKQRLERLLIISAVALGYFYIYLYQNMLHIKVDFVDLKTLLQIPVISIIVIPLILYLIVKPDPLQRSPSQKKEIKFFQNEFPSRYILDRCQRCIEDETSCRNFIKPQSYDHVRHWFQDIFHGAIEKESPRAVRDTFEKGYTCKLLYYLRWILIFVSILAIATTVLYHLYLYFVGQFRFEVSVLQMLFIIICICIVILIGRLNVPDENSPSGCWQAWREINRMHVSWLRSHDDILVNVICNKGGGNKRFREKAVSVSSTTS